MFPLFAFIVAMFVTMALIPPLMRSAHWLSFLDRPDPRKVHAIPIPRVGGVAMVVGATIPLLLWNEIPRWVACYLVGVVIIFVFGIWDDRKSIDYRLKFAGQIAAVAVVVLLGDVRIRFLPFMGVEQVGDAISIPLTMFALLGVTNAINLADGLDGLAGGTTLLTLGMLTVLAYAADDMVLLSLGLAVAGSTVGFLRYNTHPAQLFMGDTGSQFLGFSTGCLVVVLTQHSNPTLTPSMALLLLGLPIIDTLIVIGQRLAEGRSPFKPDRNHVHHKLLELGFDHYEAVVLIYLLQAALVTGAFVFRYESDWLNMGIFFGALAGLMGVFMLGNRHHWRAHHRDDEGSGRPLSRALRRVRHSEALTRLPIVFVSVSVPVYCMHMIDGIETLTKDGAAAVMLLALLSFLLMVSGRLSERFDYSERLILYPTIVAVVYYSSTGTGVAGTAFDIEHVFLGLLVFALLVVYRFSGPRSFAVTPMDYLVILIAVIMSSVIRYVAPESNIGEVAAKSVILIYAGEMLIVRAGNKVWAIRAAMAAILAVFAMKVI